MPLTRHTFNPDDQGDCRDCPLPIGNMRAHFPTEPITGTTVDLAEGVRRRDAGMAQATDAAEPWSETATRCIERLAAKRSPFTADDVIAEVGLPHDSEVNANNAVGGLFAGASRRKIIRRTGRTVPSGRTVGHARHLTEWTGES